MKTLGDILIERQKETEKYFNNYLEYARLIKEEARRLLGDARVFIFGSILRKEEPKRDIDILIISSKLKSTRQKSRCRAEIYKKIGLSTPFEIHLISPEEYRYWYKFFLKEKIEV